MKNFFRCVGATIVYWLIVLFGSSLILLLNDIGYYVSGAGFLPGSLMYKITEFMSQPIACIAAAYIATPVTAKKHSVCVLVNSVICSCFLFLLVFFVSSTSFMWSTIASVAACIYTVADQAIGISKMTKKQENTHSNYYDNYDYRM